jgi:hypothetical protein
MKLKWSELKVIVMDAFDLFKKDKALKVRTVETMLYQRYRETLPKRIPFGTEAVRFEQLNRTWDQQARALTGPLKSILPTLNDAQATNVRRHYLITKEGLDPEDEREFDYWMQRPELLPLTTIVRHQPKPPHPFQMKLQFEKDGKTVQEDTAPVNKKIEAILCSVDNATSRSRLSLVVHPQCTGQPLLRKLHTLAVTLKHVGSSSSGAICDFKVMSPELGSEGPESAVIYLSRPLNDPNVNLLIMQLCSFLKEDLMDLNTCPFGLIKLAKGIYGADIPGSTIEKEVVGHDCASSAGGLIAAIASEAAWDAAMELYGADVNDKTRQQKLKNRSEEDFVKAWLRVVLKELNWQLEG